MNTDSTKFRNVDVDEYDEDNYQDDEGKVDDGSSQVSDRAAEVKSLLNMTKGKEALKVALQNPPVGSKDPSVKAQNYETVLSVLKTFRTNDIEAAVEDLDMTEIDTLMKYLYKGFTCSPDKAQALLAWHEKVVKKGGHGSIIRVMVDRKGV